MGVSHGGETCTWVGCVHTTYEKGGSDSKGTGPRDRLGDGDLYETCRVNLPVPYLPIAGGPGVLTHPAVLDRLAILSISQLGAQFREIAQPGDRQVFLVEGGIEETFLGFEDRGEDVGFAVAVTLSWAARWVRGCRGGCFIGWGDEAFRSDQPSLHAFPSHGGIPIRLGAE